MQNDTVNDRTEVTKARRYLLRERLYSFPYWAVIIILVGAYVASQIANNETFSNIFNQLSEGISVTLLVSIISYAIGLVIALIIGLIRAFPPKPASGLIGSLMGAVRVFLYNIATIYVEVMRGLPILITLLIVAFVLFPILRDDILEPLFNIEIDVRGGSPLPAIFALSLTYGAFMSETMRAGIQSIERGQMEAAKSLGMNNFQAIRHVILPQAVRRVLPPLGNDFIAMIKDSSLVSVLGIRDVTQIARVSSGRSFRYLETYLIVAFVYLTMTMLGSQIVRTMERNLKNQSSEPNILQRLWVRVSGTGGKDLG
jgi:ABC-type amino acid transport system permease subunit